MSESHRYYEVRNHARSASVASAKRMDPIEAPQRVCRAFDLVAAIRAFAIHPVDEFRNKILYVSRMGRLALTIADRNFIPRIPISAAARIDVFDRQSLKFTNVQLTQLRAFVVADHESGDEVDLLNRVFGFQPGLVLGRTNERPVGWTVHAALLSLG